MSSVKYHSGSKMIKMNKKFGPKDSRVLSYEFSRDYNDVKFQKVRGVFISRENRPLHFEKLLQACFLSSLNSFGLNKPPKTHIVFNQESGSALKMVEINQNC